MGCLRHPLRRQIPSRYHERGLLRSPGTLWDTLWLSQLGPLRQEEGFGEQPGDVGHDDEEYGCSGNA
jgi:hypothetical protein